MRRDRDFLNLTIADFVVRAAYQMGKTPLLPIFAAALGASDIFLGFIVSVSTMTGLFLKPLIGILSDRWGRRTWLLAGTAFFVSIPFLYRFVQTPEQLLVLRVIHGTATAIYGPVTLAYIAELKPKHVAESIGWFGIARSGGYIVGPAIAGWLLLWLDPATVFTLIGLISVLALPSVLSLREIGRVKTNKQRAPLLRQIGHSVRAGLQTPAIWLAGLLEAASFIALYTLKAFLPIYALSIGVNVALVGLFFSVQEAAHVLAKPLMGRSADRLGYLPSIAVGMSLLAIGMLAIPMVGGLALLLPAVMTGIAQALIFPATVALISKQIDALNLGAGMGFLGMMQNLGKVLGPILGGLLITQLSFGAVVNGIAIVLLTGACALYILAHLHDIHHNSAVMVTPPLETPLQE